jgi:hypothetical protein
MAYEKFRIASQSAPIGRAAQGPGGDAQRIAAQTFQRIGGIVSDMADRAAADEGKLKGAEAGFDQEFRPRRDGTIYGEAFDAAALRSHATMLDGEIRNDLAKAFDETGFDPVAFEARAGEIYKKRIETLPVEIRADLAAQFERQTFAYNRDLARRQQEVVLEEQRGALTGGLAQRKADFGRMAYTLGLDADADERLSAEAEDISGWLATFGPKEAFSFGGREFAADATRGGVIGADDIAAFVVDLQGEAAFNRVKGAFDRTKGLGAREKFLTDFMGQWQKGEGVTEALTLDGAEQLQRWMQTQINADLAEQRAREAEIRARATDLRATLREYSSFPAQGLALPPGLTDTLRAEARAIGAAGLVQEIDQLDGLVDLARNAAQASPAAVAAEIQRVRAGLQGGATPAQAAALDVLEDTLSGMSTALSRDPMTWAIRAGVVAPSPLAFQADPETGLIEISAESLAARRASAERVSATYGVPLKPFTAEEMTSAKAIESMGGANMLGLARSIVQSFGSDAPAALAQLSDSAPQLAHLGALSLQGSGLGTLTDAARGYELMAQKTGTQSGVSNALGTTPEGAARGGELVNRLVREATRDQPQLRETIRQTAEAIYVGRRGLGAPWSEDAFTRAVQEASGAAYVGGVQYGGLVPSDSKPGHWSLIAPNWLRADALHDVLQGLSPADYANAGLGGQPVRADGNPVTPDQMKRAKITTLAPGVYGYSMFEGGEEVPVMAADGEPYVLDLQRIRGRMMIDGASRFGVEGKFVR